MNKAVCSAVTGIIGLLSAVSLFAADNVGHVKAGIVSHPAEASPGALTLWYRQPADKWVEALPIGNGRLGAMVFGGIEKERIQLNEDTIWAGRQCE